MGKGRGSLWETERHMGGPSSKELAHIQKDFSHIAGVQGANFECGWLQAEKMKEKLAYSNDSQPGWLCFPRDISQYLETFVYRA